MWDYKFIGWFVFNRTFLGHALLFEVYQVRSTSAFIYLHNWNLRNWNIIISILFSPKIMRNTTESIRIVEFQTQTTIMDSKSMCFKKKNVKRTTQTHAELENLGKLCSKQIICWPLPSELGSFSVFHFPWYSNCSTHSPWSTDVLCALWSRSSVESLTLLFHTPRLLQKTACSEHLWKVTFILFPAFMGGFWSSLQSLVSKSFQGCWIICKCGRFKNSYASFTE